MRNIGFRLISIVWALSLFVAMLRVGLNVPVVLGNGTIYIRADGSVDGTDKIQRNGNLYTFIDDVNETIEVQRDSIVVSGDGHALRTQGSRVYGFYLNGRSGVTIKDTRVEGFDHGIWLVVSSNNNIVGNNVTGNYNGVFLTLSSGNNIITGNAIYENRNAGIIIGSSIGNAVWDNNITGNRFGTNLFQSSNNRFYRNNFVDNHEHVSLDETGYANFWDNGVEGNYWSNYTGTDGNNDGLGDTPYIINEDNKDNHPHISATKTDPWQASAPELPTDSAIPYALIAVVITVVAGVAFLAIRRKKKLPEEVGSSQSFSTSP